MKIIGTLLTLSLMVTHSHSQDLKKADTVSVNGIHLYYEVYGEGEPLFLLHGWTQSSQFWMKYMEAYAKKFKVYAIDLRGHGRTTPLDEDFSIKEAAKDIIGLMDYLQLKKVKAMGLSYGGITLLQLSSLYPDRIETMVLIGASHHYSGRDNQILSDKFTFDALPSAFIEELRELHHHGEDQIKALFDPELDYEIRLTEKDLQSMEAKTFIINGDSDEVLGVNAAFELHKNLPNSYLWIVPDAGHIPMNRENTSEFINLTTKFLDSSM